jgi:hypothetical protein
MKSYTKEEKVNELKEREEKYTGPSIVQRHLCKLSSTRDVVAQGIGFSLSSLNS